MSERGTSFFLHLLLVCQPRNRILHNVKFLGKIRLEVLNLFVQCVFYYIYPLVSLSIYCLMFFYKIPTILLKFIIACSTGKRMVAAVVEMKNHIAVVHQGVHLLEVLVSRRG